ncbi:hypothetical protein L6164_002462 [Bauhinia variegata]|uniref:Uncharacterized protein n=1 Tax=Bauhinia variegata TaxID=167791 RepID=A0ACB9PYF0_BAUVA|nr:hypothetical protein L6164_002462 [Bauhinia variegata]
MASLKIAMVVLMCFSLMGASITQATISCGQVRSALTPCLNYLQNTGPLAPPCCASVKNLAAAAQTTGDKQVACNCLKFVPSKIPNLNQGNVASLPGKCGFSFPYKISASTNCATYV